MIPEAQPEAGIRLDAPGSYDITVNADACVIGDGPGMQCGAVRVEPIAGTCTYAIPCAMAPAGDSRYGVVVDGTDLSQDATATNSWSYTDTDRTAVRIDGPLCTEIMNGAIVEVSIRFLC